MMLRALAASIGLVAAAGCTEAARPAAGVPPAASAETTPEAEPERSDAILPITQVEADALARDLAESIRRSDLNDDERAVLLERTSPRAFIDSEGATRIGRWLLMRSDDEWVLFHRFLPPDPRKYLAFSAAVTRTRSGFTVGPVQRVLMHAPRSGH